MIGKSSWFARRKYTGWGFSPKTWQGWVYIFAMILPLVILSNLNSLGTFRVVAMAAWAVVFIIDFVHIALHMEKDERDRIHEAIAERNALWVIVTVLALGIVYQAVSAAASQSLTGIDPTIFIALGAGLVAKIVSNIYLDRKD